MTAERLRGRQAEARTNDERIVAAALEVFAADQRAPMSAVAARAAVGQASLYRRYPSKQRLLAEVCQRGMSRTLAAAEQALAEPGDPGAALAGFLSWYVESGTTRLAALLGSFRPAEDLFTLARRTNEAMQALVDRAVDAGAIRDDVTGADLTLLATLVAGLEAGDVERGAELRGRCLELIRRGLASRDGPPLPGPAPDAAELEAPWRAVADPRPAQPSASQPATSAAQ